MISSMGDTWVHVLKMDGTAAEITSDDFGINVDIIDKPFERVDAKIRLLPSDVKALHEFFGKALENWDKDEL